MVRKRRVRKGKKVDHGSKTRNEKQRGDESKERFHSTNRVLTTRPIVAVTFHNVYGRGWATNRHHIRGLSAPNEWDA